MIERHIAVRYITILMYGKHEDGGDLQDERKGREARSAGKMLTE